MRKLGHNAKSGYFAQHRAAMLNPQHTVLQEALDTPQRVTEQAVRNVLGSFLFRGDDVFKPVSVLSGGEKSRLALVKLLLDPPNLLLMDEPTTHLDLASVDALIEALKQYRRHADFHQPRRAFHPRAVQPRRARRSRASPAFHRRLPVLFGQNRAIGARGADQFELHAMAQSASEPPPRRTVDRKEQKRIEAEQRQARSRKRQEIQKRIAALEKEIAGLEAQEKELAAELEKPESYAGGRAMQINRELMHVHDRLPQATAEWEAAGTELAE